MSSHLSASCAPSNLPDAEITEIAGKLSWCCKVKSLIADLGWPGVWGAPGPVRPDFWWYVRSAVHRHVTAAAAIKLIGQSSLETFRQLGSQPLESCRLDRALRHPGGLLRLKLRCGGAPLMMAVGPRANVPREQRTCRICGSGELETAEHFVSGCAAYAAE